MTEKPLFIFDGECVLCSRGVRFLMRQDKKRLLTFTSTRTDLGASLYAQHDRDPEETYLLVEGAQAWGKSDGYLRLCSILGGPWRWLRIAKLVPRPVRDWLYDLIARNRYQWFGRTEYCALLGPEDRDRLIS